MFGRAGRGIRGRPAQAGPSRGPAVGHGVPSQPGTSSATPRQTLPPVVSVQSLDVKSDNASNDGNRGSGSLRGTVGRAAVRQRLNLELEEQTLKTRPSSVETKQGSDGTPVRLVANYFPLRTKMEWSIYQYRVDFSEELDQMQMKRRLISQHREVIGTSYLFDGTMIFSTRIIVTPNKVLNLVGKIEPDNRPVNITIKYVGSIQRGHLAYLQVFNILMRRSLDKLKLQLVGRNMFDPQASIKLNEFKIEVWPGYLTSIRQLDGGIMMNCEFSNKVMRRETAYDILFEISGREPGNTVEAYRRAMLGQVIMTPYNNKTYRIDDIDFDSSPQSTFELSDGKQTSYITYYQQRYNKVIRNHTQPLLISRAKARDIRGGKASLLCLIPELCVMTGLTQRMKQDFRLTRELDNVTKLKPNDRAQRLIAFNQRLHSNPEIVREFEGWDLGLSKDLIEVPARILDIQDIICGGQESINPDPNGDWTRAFQSKKMFLPEPITRWVVICPKNYQREAAYFLEHLMMKVVRPLGIELNNPEMYYVDNDYARTLVNAVDRICAEGRPGIIMAILSSANEEKYNAFKKKCYVDRAVLSQVILSKNLTHKNNKTIATKVAIQMSCKLGGAAWGVRGLPSGAMIVGFDVCHDCNDKRKSYGALVATQNSAMTHWYSTVTPNKSGEELSNTIPTDLTKALQGWYEINGSLPQRIIFYRDGVGDGQLQQVFNHEVSNMQKALTHMYQGDSWKMAVIIVTKRINTRFFTRNNQNPVPRTVVDDVVTQPEKYDFFLVSQSVRVGTASPTAYNVISDNTGWKPNHLQCLSFKLTHLYYNVSASVGSPAPCKYAHKLAFMAGRNLHTLPHPQLARKLYYL